VSRCCAVVCFALALLLGSAPAEACSICLAGDPRYSAFGASAEPAGSFSLHVEGRYFDKSSEGLPHGHEEDEEEEHENPTEDSNGARLDVSASWSPTDRLTLSANVPFVWNHIVEIEDHERSTHSLNGWGDASLGASVVLWQNRDVLPSTWLEGRLWGKAPTGRDNTKVHGEPDPHLQPGSGSWDWGSGLSVVHRLAWGSLYASSFYRENGEGSFDYEYGDAFFANAAVEAPLGHWIGRPEWDLLTPGVELNFRYAGYDHADGERYDDSGGAILYAAPSLRIQLPFGIRERKASLRASVQIPLGQTWLHHTQQEGEVWSLGLLLPF